MIIVLSAVDDVLYDAWKLHCGDLSFVELHKGPIFDAHANAIVSPANSFGFMDGGIDALYTKRFGTKVQERLQNVIKTKHRGELLVGMAEVISTDDAKIPFVISAPTMRVPMVLTDTVNPYLAARAVLTTLKYEYVGIHRVAFPGLGTGVGRVDPLVCALQMRAAINDVILGLNPFPGSWWDASTAHQSLYSGEEPIDLQYA